MYSNNSHAAKNCCCFCGMTVVLLFFDSFIQKWMYLCVYLCKGEHLYVPFCRSLCCDGVRGLSASCYYTEIHFNSWFLVSVSAGRLSFAACNIFLVVCCFDLCHVVWKYQLLSYTNMEKSCIWTKCFFVIYFWKCMILQFPRKFEICS